MANKLDNLIPIEEVNSRRTREQHSEDSRRAGIASGKARREKATMKKTLELLLDETYKNGKTYRELATIGLLKGAINGNAQNYRTILETLGELKQLEEDKMKRELTNVEKLLNQLTNEATNDTK